MLLHAIAFVVIVPAVIMIEMFRNVEPEKGEYFNMWFMNYGSAYEC